MTFSTLLMKRWALFKETLPAFKRGARLSYASQNEAPQWKNRAAAEAYAKGFLGQEREVMKAAERQFGIRIQDIVVPVGATEEQMIAEVRRARPEVIRLDIDTRFDGPFERFLVSERILTDLVVRAGGFPEELFRGGIEMVARVLRGQPTATLPAVQGTRYTVKINPRMAKAMGITLPQAILLQAEQIDD
jgi:hypothetical protein